MGDDVQVSYSLKEVLSGMDAKLDVALDGLRNKADAAVVADLMARVAATEAFIEDQRQQVERRDHKREWLIPVLLTAVYLVVTILQALHM